MNSPFMPPAFYVSISVYSDTCGLMIRVNMSSKIRVLITASRSFQPFLHSSETRQAHRQQTDRTTYVNTYRVRGLSVCVGHYRELCKNG